MRLKMSLKSDWVSVLAPESGAGRVFRELQLSRSGIYAKVFDIGHAFGVADA
jgi:hypothetical protein